MSSINDVIYNNALPFAHPKRGTSIKILIRKVFFKVEINYHNVETTT